MRMRTAKIPKAWPPDPHHTYSLWLESPMSPGSGSRAYVTAHPVYRDIGVRSRFAIRLDLPGTYPSKSAAVADGYAAADRFFHGKRPPDSTEESKDLRGHRITAHARFRIDCHEWEPTLVIRSASPRLNGPVQTFDGSDSPFLRRTFPSASAATAYAVAYGERLVLGLIRGLRV